jgi:hypothetical protein
MSYTPTTYSDYAVEMDIRRIEKQRERAEEAMIDAAYEGDPDEYNEEI